MTGNEYAQKIAGLQKISRIKNNNITCKQSPGLSTTSIHTFELLLIEQEQGRKIKKEKERRKGKSNDTYDPILYERKVDLRNIKICFTKKEGDGSVLSFIKGRYRYKRHRSSKGGRVVRGNEKYNTGVERPVLRKIAAFKTVLSGDFGENERKRTLWKWSSVETLGRSFPSTVYGILYFDQIKVLIAISNVIKSRYLVIIYNLEKRKGKVRHACYRSIDENRRTR